MEMTSFGTGTYWYQPPECFETANFNLGNTKYGFGEFVNMISTKVDVWSVGVVFFEMLYGKRPFGDDLTQKQIMRNNVILKSTKVKFPEKPIVSQDSMNFITKCLTYDQNERIDVFQAYDLIHK